jgi:D-serine deaminase-like pyridoxal phosphate-dependent protein
MSDVRPVRHIPELHDQPLAVWSRLDIGFHRSRFRKVHNAEALQQEDQSKAVKNNVAKSIKPS